MPAMPVEIRATLFDLASKSSREVFLSGVAYRSDVGVGGGPMPGGPGLGFWGGRPPEYVDIGGPPQQGEGIWPSPGYPAHPIAPGGPPPYPSQGPGFPTHPIVIPVPPNTPNVPPPGSPPVIVGGAQPVQPMEPPVAVVIEYPGIGKVIVPKPTEPQEG